MSGYEFDPELYHGQPFSRKRSHAEEVFHTDFRARDNRREQAFRAREMMGSPAYRPPPIDDPYYHDDRSWANQLPYSSSVSSKAREMMPARDTSKGMRRGSVIVYPSSKKPRKYDTAPSITLFVGALPKNIKSHHLEDLFSEYGRIDHISLKEHFAHVIFNPAYKEELIKALELDGSLISLGPGGPGDEGTLIVQFSIKDSETKRKENTLIPFTLPNAATMAGTLFREAKFTTAARSLKNWFLQGHCKRSTSQTFYSLLNNINTCVRRTKKQLGEKNENLVALLKKHKTELEIMELDCQLVIEIFQAANQQKSYDNFTKGQRKNISTWSSAALELQSELLAAINNPLLEEDWEGPAPTKIRKVEDEALQEKVRSMSSILERFKQECPSDWARITAGNDPLEDASDNEEEAALCIVDQVIQTDDKSVSSDQAEGIAVAETIHTDETDPVVEATPSEERKNEMDLVEEEAGATDMAQAAAAYAQIRSTIAQDTGEGVSQVETAILAVMATFLTVHPMGATIQEITTYFQGFNPLYNAPYLESLLRRFSQLFQLTAGEERWWFMGFQTCYTAVGGDQQTTDTPSQANDEK